MGTPQARIDTASEGIGRVYEKTGTVSASSSAKGTSAGEVALKGTVTAGSGTLRVAPRRLRGSRTTRRGRAAVIRRSRPGTRVATPTRGSPDDDPEQELHPFDPLPPVRCIRGQLQLWPEPRR